MGKRNGAMKFQQMREAQAQEPVEDKAAGLREAIQVLAVNRCPVKVQGRAPISSIELQKAGKEWYGGVLRRVDGSTWEWNPQWTGGVVHVGDNGKSVEVPCYAPELAAERASLLVVAAALALGLPPSEAKLLPPAQGFLRRAAEMKSKASAVQNGFQPPKAPSKFAPKMAPKAVEPPTKKPKVSGPDPILVSTRHEHRQLQEKVNRQQPVDTQQISSMVARLIKQVNACLSAASTTADKPSARQLLTTLTGLQGQCQDPSKAPTLARSVVNSLGAWITRRDQNGATPAGKAAVAPAKASKAPASTIAAKVAVAQAAVAQAKAPGKGPKVHVIKPGAWAKAGVLPGKAASQPGRGKVLYSSKWNKVPVVKPAHKTQPAKFQTFNPFFPKAFPGKAPSTAATKAALLAKAPEPKAPPAKPVQHFAKASLPKAQPKIGKGLFHAAKPAQQAAPPKFGKGGFPAGKPAAVVAPKGGKGMEPARPAPPAKFGKGLQLTGKGAAPVQFGQGQTGQPAVPAKAWQKGGGKGQLQHSASAPLVGVAQSKGQQGAGNKAGGKGSFPAPAVGALPRSSSTPVVVKGAGKAGGKGQKKGEWHAPVVNQAGKGKGRGRGQPAVDVGQFFMNR
mmetsp:Transcript_12369/g.29457  ORF Transcript_12369/g.29457 Transcript_12369/m.29457 type:complete len:620 (-) Transcript_12369:279-2138(-)